MSSITHTNHHQLKFMVVVLIGLNLPHHVITLYKQLKLMEPYGDGEVEDLLIMHQLIVLVHHQLKYLVLIGLKLVPVIIVFGQQKLMELYGHGEIILMVN